MWINRPKSLLFVELLTGLLILLHEASRINAGMDEKRLLAYLFDPKRADAHNRVERPVRNESNPVQVRFGTTLTQLMDVDEKNQIIKTSIMLLITWRDYHFSWNPRDYGGITVINVHPSLVWIPDVLLYNSADVNFNAANTVMVNIYSDGRLVYTPPGLFKSTCLINVRWFPFDRQRCILKFGTWSYDGRDVDLKINCAGDDLMLENGNCTKFGKVDLSYYIFSGEWELLKSDLIRFKKKYDCCPQLFIDIKVVLEIKRKALYYLFNFVLPCIIISIMALLDFLLPSDAGEKISLGVTIMLSLSMFQLILADLMPQSSMSSPLLAIYFCSMMMLSSLSILFTVLVLSCHHNDHEIPRILRICVNQWLCRFMLMTPISAYNESPSSQSSSRQSSLKNKSSKPQFAAKPIPTSSSLLANVLELSSDTHNIYQNLFSRKRSLQELEAGLDGIKEIENEDEAYGVESGGTIGVSCSLHTDMHDIRTEIEFITDKISESDDESDLLREWKFAAYVIDRFCVVTFSLLAFFVTAGIFILGANSWLADSHYSLFYLDFYWKYRGTLYFQLKVTYAYIIISRQA